MVSLKQRLEQLTKAQDLFPDLMGEAQKGAAMRAVEAAADATPPTADNDELAGTNMRTGELKAHWETDSKTEPERVGDTYVSTLANNMEYASYVNDGHRMKRRFVPGLYIDPDSGHLEYDQKMADSRSGGLMVGTRTKCVEGLFMTDKAKEAYEKVLTSELDKNIQEALQ